MNDKLGMNETIVIYECPVCRVFKIQSRVIGNERILDTRRAYCERCGTYVIMELKKGKKI